MMLIPEVASAREYLYYFTLSVMERGLEFASQWRQGFFGCDSDIPVLWGTSAGVFAGAWAPGGICMPV